MSRSSVPSVPEPPPTNLGINVPQALSAFIKDNYPEQQYCKVIDLIGARAEYGFKKYGQYLKTFDGRDDIEDARQEFGDLLQYLFKARLNGRIQEFEEFKAYLTVLSDLINDKI
jgi:hypothetical protein